MLTSPMLRMREAGDPAPDYFASSSFLSRGFAQQSSNQLQLVPAANAKLKSPAEELALRLAGAQRELSLVSMHLPLEMRNRTLLQLRQLLNTEDWEEGDAYLKPESFRSFARAMAVLVPRERPLLGLSEDGNLLAMWAGNRSRLSFEHLANDSMRWFVENNQLPMRDVAAGMTSVEKLLRFVDAHEMRPLLDGEG